MIEFIVYQIISTKEYNFENYNRLMEILDGIKFLFEIYLISALQIVPPSDFECILWSDVYGETRLGNMSGVPFFWRYIDLYIRGINFKKLSYSAVNFLNLLM